MGQDDTDYILNKLDTVETAVLSMRNICWIQNWILAVIALTLIFS